MGEFKPSAAKYPKLKKFKDRATEEAKKQKAKTSLSEIIKIAVPLVSGYLIAENTATACGTYAFPKPNVTPTRYYYTQTSPPAKDWLLTNGFHSTQDYATGNYENNYTRPTFYKGVEGTCDSPKFRDDGTVTGTYSMNIQYKEPNPEVLNYGNWPYLGWQIMLTGGTPSIRHFEISIPCFRAGDFFTYLNYITNKSSFTKTFSLVITSVVN